MIDVLESRLGDAKLLSASQKMGITICVSSKTPGSPGLNGSVSMGRKCAYYGVKSQIWHTDHNPDVEFRSRLAFGFLIDPSVPNILFSTHIKFCSRRFNLGMSKSYFLPIFHLFLSWCTV